ncbi:MAG: ATP-binding cassette domain-containing protein [Solirubrobacterales bacterium]
MILLELEHVGKSYSRGARGARVVLDDLSLVIDAGEMVVVFGERQSGRSTLMRIAAGVERPSKGVVRFDGRDLAERGGEMLGGGISYCRREFLPDRGLTVLDQLRASQLARRVPQSTALTHAWKALERVDALWCASLIAGELKIEETVRVALARALTSQPRLLVVDEPTIGVESIKRDDILKLLRSLANGGIAILASAGDGTELLGADRVLSLGKGKLFGELTPDLAPVTDLGRRRQARGASGIA